MNFARVIEVDNHPMLIVYSRRHGGHQHTEIPIAGQCVWFENEEMPKEADVEHWLMSRLQESFNCQVRVSRYDTTAVFINSWSLHQPARV